MSRLAEGGLDRQHTPADTSHVRGCWTAMCTIALADPERIGNVLKDGPAGDGCARMEVRRGCWETGWKQGDGAKGLLALLWYSNAFFSPSHRKVFAVEGSCACEESGILLFARKLFAHTRTCASHVHLCVRGVAQAAENLVSLASNPVLAGH